MTKFSSTYPNIASWIESYGWIEIGQDDYSQSFIRVLDIGGMLWESKPNYRSFDDALNWKYWMIKFMINFGRLQPQLHSNKVNPSLSTHSPFALHLPHEFTSQKIRVGCPAHNCGGRCLLIAHIEDGKIVRLDTDDRPDTIAAPQLRACVRGRAYLRRQYHPDRLLYPLKRVGKRGEGKFVRISWDEALDDSRQPDGQSQVRVRQRRAFRPVRHGQLQPAQRVACRPPPDESLWRLSGHLQLLFVGRDQHRHAHRLRHARHGQPAAGLAQRRYILMWGWNPAEMRDGTNTDYFIKLARENGARVVCIDPRHSLSAAALADEWIPIRPGTDAAMMSAMAYVMLTENLYDAEFVRTHCVGFDASQMPVEGAESYSDYLLGARDGIPKTPEWAEAITAVPAATIARIAREYATIKPAVLYQGYGMQRRAYGEQVVRAGCVLAAITGNVGIPGGWASGLGLQADDGGLSGLFSRWERILSKRASRSFSGLRLVCAAKS